MTPLFQTFLSNALVTLALQHVQFWANILSDNFAYLIYTHKISYLYVCYY